MFAIRILATDMKLSRSKVQDKIMQSSVKKIHLGNLQECGKIVEGVWLWRISGGYSQEMVGFVLEVFPFTCSPWSVFEREKIHKN